MALMGYREYARHRGCSLYAVQKAIADKRIRVQQDELGRWRIDSEQADAAWAQNTDPAKQSLLHRAAPASPTGSVEPPASGRGDSDEPAAEDSTAEYRAARAEREQIRVRRERLDLEVQEGSLVPLAAAQQLVFTAFRQLRDAVLNVPARIKHQLAAEADPDKLEQALEAELGAALSGFSVEAALKPQDDEEDEEG